MSKIKKFIIPISVIIILSIIGIFIITSNSNKISIRNIKLSDDVIKTVDNKDMEDTLRKYIIAEIELYNNNEKNTVIEQTSETNELIDKIMSKVDKSDVLNRNQTKKELHLQVIYLGITEISRTMLLQQPVSITIGENSSSYTSGKDMQLTDEQYEKYMSEVKESIEKVLNEYCK